MKFTEHRIIRMFLAGGINTLFGLLVFSMGNLAGLQNWLSLLLSLIFGVIFNFFTTGGYVFRQLTPSRFPKFVIAYFLVYALNLLLISQLTKVTHSEIISQTMLCLPLALLSYYLLAQFVFRDASPTTSGMT